MTSCRQVTFGSSIVASALETLYGGQLTLSTQLINPHCLVILPHLCDTMVSLEISLPLYNTTGSSLVTCHFTSVTLRQLLATSEERLSALVQHLIAMCSWIH